MAITTDPAAPGINFSHMPDGRNGAGRLVAAAMASKGGAAVNPAAATSGIDKCAVDMATARRIAHRY